MFNGRASLPSSGRLGKMSEPNFGGLSLLAILVINIKCQSYFIFFDFISWYSKP